MEVADPEVQPEEHRAKLRLEASQKRLADTQKILRKDAALNENFDNLLKEAAAPKIKKPKPPVKRSQGRPKKIGHIILTQKSIDSLPEFIHLSSLARILNLKHTTVQQWCSLEKHHLPFTLERKLKNGRLIKRKLFRKDVVVKWLIATKRFDPKN